MLGYWLPFISDTVKIFINLRKSFFSFNSLQQKEKLKKEFPKLINIFTVSEIKGSQYPNIITYNILSDYYDIFQNFYDPNWKKDKNYDFYFNQFYVAITRGEHNIYILEEKENIDFLNDILSKTNKYEIKYKYFENINNISDVNFDLEEATDERYYKKAMIFFNNEEFEKAKENFEKVTNFNFETTKYMIDICEKFILEPNMNYKKRQTCCLITNNSILHKNIMRKITISNFTA